MLIRLGFLTLSLTLVGACGGGGGGVPADELADELEQTLCEAQVACGAFPDLQTCRDTVFIDVDSNIPQLLALVDAGRLNYDEDLARECLDLYTDALGECTVFGADPEIIEQINETCSNVFSGDAAVGEVCYADEECAGDAECNVATDCQDQCCTGTCVAVTPLPDAEIGESCAAADCVSGAYCDTNDVCQAVAGVGETCEGFGSCVTGAVCDFDFQTNTGTCVQLPAEGDTCDPELFFGIITCMRTDNWCDPADMVCKKKLAVGADCDVEIGGCADYAYCNAGTCTALPGNGGTCDIELGPDCLGDLDCVDQVCTAPEAEPICTDVSA
jgi:hypothetical protein